MRTLLIFGLLPQDSGKTTVASALCRGLHEIGVKVKPFKPRAGHNLWYQYDVYERCRREGRLYCEDIIKLREASRCPLPYELLNPIDALLSPLMARDFLEEGRGRELYLLEEDTYAHLVAERYTIWDGALRHRIILNRHLSYRLLIDEDYLDRLRAEAVEVMEVDSLEEWMEKHRSLAPRAISTCMRAVSKNCEVLIIEGYNDAASPTPEAGYDVVIGVSPGLAVFYDTSEYSKILEAYRGLGREPMGLRAGDVIPFLKPEGFVEIPPLRRSELGDYDRLSERLSDLVEAALRYLGFDSRGFALSLSSINLHRSMFRGQPGSDSWRSPR